MFWYDCIVINVLFLYFVLFLYIYMFISFSVQARWVMKVRQNHNQARQCIIILYCNSGLGSSKGNSDKDVESDTERVKSGSNSEGQESAEERSSEGQVDVGRSEATGEAESDWKTENIIYDAIECGKHWEKVFWIIKGKKPTSFTSSGTKFQVRQYVIIFAEFAESKACKTSNQTFTIAHNSSEEAKIHIWSG